MRFTFPARDRYKDRTGFPTGGQSVGRSFLDLLFFLAAGLGTRRRWGRIARATQHDDRFTELPSSGCSRWVVRRDAARSMNVESGALFHFVPIDLLASKTASTHQKVMAKHRR